jgi:hypothetical protein
VLKQSLITSLPKQNKEPLSTLQHGRAADAEAAIRKLWGADKTAGAIVELKESAESGKGEEEAGWGDLVSKRYRRGEGGRFLHGLWGSEHPQVG